MAPCSVAVTATEVVVTVHGMDVVWALSRGLRIPLADVRDATAMGRKEIPRKAVLRVAGTSFPGLVHAGRFWSRGWWELWVAHRAPRLLVLTCGPEAKYDRVVLQVADPDADAAAITAALGTLPT